MDQEPTAQAITNLLEAWAGAELRGDIAFLENLLADDFVGVGPLGFTLTKGEWLARHQSGDLSYDVLTLDEVAVRLYDTTAMVICRQEQHVAYLGNPITGRLRATLVLILRQGSWRLAGIHLSPIRQPPGATLPSSGPATDS